MIMKENNKKTILKKIFFWKYNPEDKENYKYGIYSTLFYMLIIFIIFLIVGSFIGE